MADQKISELTNILGADVGAGDEFVVVDSSANETKAITTLELRTAIGNGDFTVTGDLTVQGTTITVDSATAQNIVLGDNDKMTFGAGSDLQIYHDGSHSYIDEAGTGDIYVSVLDDVIFRTYGTNELVARFNTNQSTGGWARLYHRGSEKLETTSTGVDVTGTVTADGLTVDTNTLHVDATNNRVGIGTASPTQILQIGSATGRTFVVDQSTANTTRLANDYSTILEAGGGYDLKLRSDGNASFGSIIFETSGTTDRMKIASNGDISFYEDTGTTAKFFWDASAESLGIGTTTISRKLNIQGDQGIRLFNNATDSYLDIDHGTNGAIIKQSVTTKDILFRGGTASGQLVFETGGSEAMRIDSSGNVGIGTSSPNSALHVSDNVTTGANFYTDANTNLYLTNSGTGNIGVFKIANETSRIVFGQNTTNDKLIFSSRHSAADSGQHVVIDNDGNVGIGRNSSSHKLEVAGELKLTSMASGEGIDIYDTGSAQVGIKAGGTAGVANMVFETANSERMRIDSSGNLIVGATSAVGDIHGQRSDGAMLWLGRTTNSGQTTALLGEIRFGDTAFDSNLAAIQSNLDGSTTSSNLRFYTQATSAASAERMRIDSSGNVGIGTASPLQALHVNSGTGNSAAIFESTDATSQIWLKDSASSSTYQTGIACYGDNLLLNNGGERMRIDSSGNLLVGKTAQDQNVAGSQLTADGVGAFTATSTSPLRVLRLTDEGVLINLFQGGTSVGIIGVASGDAYIATGDVGLRFDDGNNILRPVNNSGSDVDGAINLGGPNQRFLSAYLSGGVYLGGTGSANHLDDYEEGTFTPTLKTSGTQFTSVTYTFQDGHYTKIGREVVVHIALTVSAVSGGTGALYIGNLPFSIVGRGGGSVGYISGLNYDSATYSQIGIYTPSGGTDLKFTLSGDNVAAIEVPISNFTSSFDTIVSFTYRTS